MCVGREICVRWCVASVWAGGFLSLSLSLSRCSHFLASLWAKLKGFFTHFIVVSSYLIANFSYFTVVLTHLFTYKRHFLGHYAFLKFLNAVFLGFCTLFVILSLCKKAKNPHKLKENLPFLDTSLTLSMTNSGFCLKMTDKENALCHLARTDIFTQIAFKNLKNSTQRSQNDTFYRTKSPKFQTKELNG